MAEYTTNLNLEKPDSNDYVDITVINDNYDKIDKKIADTKDSKVTFIEEVETSDIASGDTHATLFGKIKAFFKNAKISNSLTVGTRSSAEIGEKSFTLGNDVDASGSYSFAGGLNTSATEMHAFAMGYEAKARHIGSTAFGRMTRTSRLYQAVFGKYNKGIINTLFEVGNGSSEETRSNAMAVTEEGLVIAGKDFVVGNVRLTSTANEINTIGSIIRGFGDIGSNACNAVIYSNIILKRTGTGKCDLIISGKVESITADSSCFNVFDMSKLRTLLDINSMEFNPAHTTVSLEQRFLSSDIANSGHYGYGQMFDGFTIGRFHTTDGAFGGWAANHGVYTPGTYFLINVYGATYS